MQDASSLFTKPTEGAKTPGSVGSSELSLIPKTTASGLVLKKEVCYLGKVQIKNEIRNFGILSEDRRKHIYVLGKTGMGKSTFLENLVLQDIHNGKGVCFIDPHGDSSEYILQRIPEDRLDDLVYFNPSDTGSPIGFNVLEAQNGEEHYLIVSGLMQIFAHIWSGAWSSRMEYILSNTLFALMEEPGATLLGVVRMLTDKDYRDYLVKKLKNPTVKNFWVKEFASFNEKYKTEAIAPILNKIGQFFSSEITLNILGQAASTIDLRKIMDEEKILIVNLSKGKIGEITMGLLGSLLITKIQLAAMSRVNVAESDRKDFYLYVDEFQNFITDSFATILSEARKYRLCLTIAHQYIKQLEETQNNKVKNAIFGNVGTMLTFAVGADDAKSLSFEFAPIFTEPQLVALNKYQVAIKLSINGKSSSPFLAQTLEPVFGYPLIPLGYAELKARKNGTKPVAIVRHEISQWMDKQFLEKPERNFQTPVARPSVKPYKPNTKYLVQTNSPQAANNTNVFYKKPSYQDGAYKNKSLQVIAKKKELSSILISLKEKSKAKASTLYRLKTIIQEEIQNLPEK